MHVPKNMYCSCDSENYKQQCIHKIMEKRAVRERDCGGLGGEGERMVSYRRKAEWVAEGSLGK